MLNTMICGKSLNVGVVLGPPEIEYYSAIEINELLIHATTRINFSCIRLTERS